MLATDPDTTGSLGMAISEAVEAAARDPNAHYALGSVLNHVLLHQTVIGGRRWRSSTSSARAPTWCSAAPAAVRTWPGSRSRSWAATCATGRGTEVVACEPSACPSLTQGEYRYDFGDVAGLTPLLKMHTLGNDFVPPPIHAGGLRYHGMAPMVSHAVNLGLMSAVAVDQADAFKAGVEFARAEGIIPAPESTHAVAATIDRARAATSARRIVLGLSGNGVLDLPAYGDFV